MVKKPFTTATAALRFVCLAMLGLSTMVWCAKGQYDADWSRHFRIGALVGFNIKADFQESATLNLGQNYASGVYDDGYVRTDSTGNAGGYTTYFGYNKNTQINGQTLNLSRTTSFSSGTSELAGQDSGVFPGLDMGYGGNIWYWRRFRFGWNFGFGLLPISLTTRNSRIGMAELTTDSFDTLGNTLQPAPYSGPFRPPSSGSIYPPLLTATPGSTSVSSTTTATLATSQTLDVILYTMRLGPSVYWDFNRHLGMSLGAGPALGVVSGDLKSSRSLSTGARHEAKVGATDIVYGGYVSGTLMYHTVQGGDIYLGAQYMPLNSATFGNADSSARLKLDGALYVSAGFNWPF